MRLPLTGGTSAPDIFLTYFPTLPHSTHTLLKSTGSFWALKMLKKAEVIRLQQVEHMISEKTILSRYVYSHVVSIKRFRMLFMVKSSSNEAIYIRKCTPNHLFRSNRTVSLTPPPPSALYRF